MRLTGGRMSWESINNGAKTIPTRLLVPDILNPLTDRQSMMRSIDDSRDSSAVDISIPGRSEHDHRIDASLITPDKPGMIENEVKRFTNLLTRVTKFDMIPP